MDMINENWKISEWEKQE